MTEIVTEDVLYAIQAEKMYQDEKWGETKSQSLAGYLLIMQNEVNEAVDGWMKNKPGRNSPLAEILQVVTVGIRALEQYGTTGITINANDIRDNGQGLLNVIRVNAIEMEAREDQETHPLLDGLEAAPLLTETTLTVADELLANGVVHMENVDFTPKTGTN